MRKKSKPQVELIVTTGIRKKTVFLEIECPDHLVCGKVLAIIDHFVDEINPCKECKEKENG